MLYNANSEPVKLLGINGMKRSGKDTLANYIQQINPHIQRVSLAHRLRKQLAEIFRFDTAYVFDEIAKDKPLPEPICLDLHLDTIKKVTGLDSIKEANKCAFTMRQLMQYYGTEYIRNINPNYWCECLTQQIAKSKFKQFVVTDIRFTNEVLWVTENGNSVIRLQRDGVRKNAADTHVSENFDFEVQNTYNIASGDYDSFRRIADECVSLYL